MLIDQTTNILYELTKQHLYFYHFKALHKVCEFYIAGDMVPDLIQYINKFVHKSCEGLLPYLYTISLEINYIKYQPHSNNIPIH